MSILKQVVIRKTLIIVNQNTVWNTFLALMVFVFGSFLPLYFNSSPVQLLLPCKYLLLNPWSHFRVKRRVSIVGAHNPPWLQRLMNSPWISVHVEGRAVKSIKDWNKSWYQAFYSPCKSLPQQHISWQKSFDRHRHGIDAFNIQLPHLSFPRVTCRHLSSPLEWDKQVQII